MLQKKKSKSTGGWNRPSSLNRQRDYPLIAIRIWRESPGDGICPAVLNKTSRVDGSRSRENVPEWSLPGQTNHKARACFCLSQCSQPEARKSVVTGDIEGTSSSQLRTPFALQAGVANHLKCRYLRPCKAHLDYFEMKVRMLCQSGRILKGSRPGQLSRQLDFFLFKQDRTKLRIEHMEPNVMEDRPRKTQHFFH